MYRHSERELSEFLACVRGRMFAGQIGGRTSHPHFLNDQKTVIPQKQQANSHFLHKGAEDEKTLFN